ncbi:MULTISPECIES: hypothetical protein [unclassified Mesorhizobium]|uniref:hypothetical protein n=1 Tax=unclassified Mesorhizobium TaxID=325217 RepID=UPI000FD9582F|nr:MULTISPECIES: hypothetical protein [unclassified Mesorhizobium]TGQ34679.1 hypothetical protein EN859_024900 [Mesorhizobium sp. M00.F.Ca.ET.216.01.1.1]TIS57589.1 MAG: hypothetical protein E5W91_13590 [Mesorhizobium sp.]TIS88634.1 MAG: hypothetical protein E5W89_19945 [Mesorhizobium sp.]TJW07275.1 MAG: hypothetical protein E5W82_23990 [Mesorhizobium sp.]TJW43503.1 MAG: hypothetical protein E5W83_17140 [Mesorhizobium sp.]
MKLALSALLVVLAISQTAEAKTKIPVTNAKAATAEKSRPQLDNTPTGGITAPAGTKAVPAGEDGYSSYPPALDIHF